MTEPRLVAFRIVDKMMTIGAQKHKGENWRTENKRMHLLKAIRHLTTCLLILDGFQEPDGESHAENGICRAAMYLAME